MIDIIYTLEGIYRGQLQRYRNNKLLGSEYEPVDEDALSPKIALLDESMIDFDERPKNVIILDEQSIPLKSKDVYWRYGTG